MKRNYFLLYILCAVHFVQAQQYAIVIKGGHVIDPKNNIDGVMDVAVSDGRVVSVAKNIDTAQAIQVVDAKGLYVVPGLIDIHTHVFFGLEPDHSYSNGPEAVRPEGFSFRSGVTTVVDAGSSGWRSFPLFKRQVIDVSQTRVLAFLNIVGEGMRGWAYEQDTRDMDAKLTAIIARQYKDFIVGIKVAHFSGNEWTPVEEALKAGNTANIPVMIDFGGSNPPLSIEELFMKRLRPGDIFTHCFGQLHDRESIVDTLTNTVKPFVWDARKKGIVFDIGFGEISFAYSQAMPAFKGGFRPNSISTDIHARSINTAMKDILNVMSRCLAMGMDMQAVVKAATWNPAGEIKHQELGHLSAGAIADIAILNLRNGKFGFFDYKGYKMEGSQRLECEMTIKGGKIVYDLNGIANPVIIKTVVQKQ